jgi:hypothetical protein
MELRIQLVAVLGTLLLLLVILELVRRRRLLERYALLWLGSAVVLLALAAWKGLLGSIASSIGIFYPPAALFVIAFGFILVLLLHFSVAVSRLADQSKVLAQRLALMEQRQKELEERLEQAGPPVSEHAAGDHDGDAGHDLGDRRMFRSASG